MRRIPGLWGAWSAALLLVSAAAMAAEADGQAGAPASRPLTPAAENQAADGQAAPRPPSVNPGLSRDAPAEPGADGKAADGKTAGGAGNYKIPVPADLQKRQLDAQQRLDRQRQAEAAAAAQKAAEDQARQNANQRSNGRTRVIEPLPGFMYR